MTVSTKQKINVPLCYYAAIWLLDNIQLCWSEMMKHIREGISPTLQRDKTILVLLLSFGI